MNPTAAAGIVDNSGVDILLTDHLRLYNAGVLALGNVLSSGPPIPGGTKDYVFESDCPSSCTSAWPHEIYVFGSFFHMHDYGTNVYTVQRRTGSRVGYTNKIEFWNSRLQQQVLTNLVLKPGDCLNTICTYDTSRSQNPVYFGSGLNDEMCVEFLTYYPKLKTLNNGKDYAFCGSVQQLQVSANKTTQTTVCGNLLDAGTIGESTGLTLKNPSDPLPDRTVDQKTFGNPPSVCTGTVQVQPVSQNVESTKTAESEDENSAAGKVTIGAVFIALLSCMLFYEQF